MAPRQRQRSVPPPTTTISESSSSLSEVTTISTPPSLATHQNPQQSKLLARAEALSRMTYELNIRAAGVQTDRLRRQVQALVQSTAEDREFRQQHEERLTKVWHEMLAVRQHVAKLDDSQDDVKVHLKQCQQETGEVIEQFRGEIGNLRELLEGLSSQMDKLPSMAEAVTDADCSLSTSQSQDQDEIRRNEPQIQDSECNIRDRIREAINSTRRWNRDYKNTDQSDADFTASYLRQQSKRDAPMAVFIQRSIGKRIRRRLPRLRSLPLTLEEFCQDVTWKDVLDAVESVLVKNQDFATRGLQRM